MSKTSSSLLTVSALQWLAVPDVSLNLAKLRQLLTQLCEQFAGNKTHLVVLPEACFYFGGQEQDALALTSSDWQQTLLTSLAELVKHFHIYLVAGTLPAPANDPNKYRSRSWMFAPTGERLGYYDKLHLFDVDVADNARHYRESALVEAGQHSQLIKLGNWVVGLSVCYDMRFPEFFRLMAQSGAQLICVPAAFTRVTGQAHWLPLLQARAIENQCYIIAAAQEGLHANGRETYGHSCIIDPWGKIIDLLATGEGFVSAEIDLNYLTSIRQQMPVLSHSRFEIKKSPT